MGSHKEKRSVRGIRASAAESEVKGAVGGGGEGDADSAFMLVE
jgi:hypothetical protein